MLLDLLYHHFLTSKQPMGQAPKPRPAAASPRPLLLPFGMPYDPAPARRRDEDVLMLAGLL